MKKRTLFGVFCGILFIAGCSSTPNIGNTADYGLDNAPKWVLSDDNGPLSAVGSAKIKNNNIQFATTQAVNAGKAEIASQIATQVESKYKDLISSDSDNISQETVQAIRNSVDKTLSGSRKISTWISKDGTLYVLVKVDRIDTKLLQSNLAQSKGVDKVAAKAISETVDEIIDGKKIPNNQ